MTRDRWDRPVQRVVTEGEGFGKIDFQTRPGNQLVNVHMNSDDLCTDLARASTFGTDRGIIGLGLGGNCRERRLKLFMPTGNHGKQKRHKEGTSLHKPSS